MTEMERECLQDRIDYFFDLCEERGFDEMFAGCTCSLLCDEEMFSPPWNEFEQFIEIVKTATPDQEKKLLSIAIHDLGGIER